MTVRQLTELLLAVPEDRKDLPIVVWGDPRYYDSSYDGVKTEGYVTPTTLDYAPYFDILNNDNPERQPGYAL